MGRHYTCGRVSCSKCVSQTKAWVLLSPHISTSGCKPPQKAGRSGLPNTLQPKFSSSCMHGTPAGLPFGMPGKGEVMEGAMQHAPQ